MIGRNSIVKQAEILTKHNAEKFRLKTPYRYREILKIRHDFTQLRSQYMTRFAPNQNLFNLVGSKKAKPISV